MNTPAPIDPRDVHRTLLATLAADPNLTGEYGDTIHTFDLFLSWKGEEKTIRIIGVSKDDVQEFFDKNCRKIAGLCKSSLRTLTLVSSAPARPAPTPPPSPEPPTPPPAPANPVHEAAFAAVREYSGGKNITTYQQAVIGRIIDALRGTLPAGESGNGHTTVNAVPGSGKSTTIEWAVAGLAAALDFAPIPGGNGRPPLILVLAFGKKIADAMNIRLAPFRDFAKSRTTNSFGWGLCLRDPNGRFANSDVKFERGYKTRAVAEVVADLKNAPEEVKNAYNLSIGAVVDLIDKFKNAGFGINGIRPDPTPADIDEFADFYDIALPDWEDVSREWFDALVFRTFDRSRRTFDIVDGTDQLYLPLYLNLQFPKYYSLIMVDESQDLNACQIEMVRRLTGRNTKLVFVGDPYQAIFGFRGAVSEAMAITADKFDTRELPLSICFRCSKAVVRKAQKINPGIQYAPDAPEGFDETINEEQLFDMVDDRGDDVVLCRTTAPLVQTCFDLIRNRKKAYVMGSDIGQVLASLVKKIQRATKRTPGRPIELIRAYGAEKCGKIEDDAKRARLGDRFDTLAVLAEGCETFKDVLKNIDEIFAEHKSGVCLATIHKAKGLEWRRTFIIRPELMPHPAARTAEARKQETYLEFVAITRAKLGIYTVETPESKRRGRRNAV